MLYDKIHHSGSFQEHQKHLDLYNALIHSISLDKAIAKGKIDPAKVLKKRCHDDRDEDPPAKYERKRRGENERIMSHQTTIKMVHLRKTNPEGDRCSFDKSKPIPLQGPPSHLTILVDFFFNNDLEYLKTRNKERKYIASLTKTTAIRLTIDNQFKYGYLKGIVVKRADPKEYTFGEANFSRLHLNDIEDIFLLYVQRKIHNLMGDEIVSLVNALRMFTRSIIIQRRVEDV
nr:hypothetical protein [Tanacetum cinerariifolium]